MLNEFSILFIRDSASRCPTFDKMRDLYDKENGGILQDKVKVLEDDTLGHRLNKLVIPGKRQKNTDSQQNLYEDFVPQEVCNVDLVFVPYYAWNNRGEGEMDVFVAIK